MLEWIDLQFSKGFLKKGRDYKYGIGYGWMSKWQSTRIRADIKGVEFNLSQDDYLSLVKEAGLTDPRQIGRSLDSYHLSRFGDTGPYEIGNCRFITMRDNLKEQDNPSGERHYKFLGYWITPAGTFSSSQAAGDANGCSPFTARERCKRKRDGYYFVEK